MLLFVAAEDVVTLPDIAFKSLKPPLKDIDIYIY
jgi:hypothetical protein